MRREIRYPSSLVGNGELGLPGWSARLISELSDADRRAETVAGGLTPVQLNWRPAEGAWSIGQCLDHLRMANEVYAPAIAAALEGRAASRVDDLRIGRISRWFIRSYAAPNPGGPRGQAPPKIKPAPEVESSVLGMFLASNAAFRELVRRVATHDVNKIRFRNPFVPLLRFTVGTGLEVIAKHQARHLLQAENVKDSAGFPE